MDTKICCYFQDSVCYNVQNTFMLEFVHFPLDTVPGYSFSNLPKIQKYNVSTINDSITGSYHFNEEYS